MKHYNTKHGLRNHKLYAKYYDIKSRLKRDIAYKDRKMCIELQWLKRYIYDPLVDVE